MSKESHHVLMILKQASEVDQLAQNLRRDAARRWRSLSQIERNEVAKESGVSTQTLSILSSAQQQEAKP